MPRIVDVIAARLAEGSVVPVLGPGLLRGGEVPDGPEPLARWLAERADLPAATPGDLARTATAVEARMGRRALLKLLRESFAAPARPGPLHLLLAGLPRLPLAISTWFDPTLLELLVEEGRDGAVAMVHGVSPQDRPDGPWAWASAEGLGFAPESETVIFHPRGVARPSPSYLVSEADLAAAGGPPPPEVRERLEGSGLLLVGCPLDEPADQAVLSSLLAVTAGPHFAVAAAPATLPEELFLERAGVTRLDLPLERFVAELSRCLASASHPDAERPDFDGTPLPVDG